MCAVSGQKNRLPTALDTHPQRPGWLRSLRVGVLSLRSSCSRIGICRALLPGPTQKNDSKSKHPRTQADRGTEDFTFWLCFVDGFFFL